MNRLSRVRATAYPKLTLSLRVLGLRKDGYHEIEALTVSLGQPSDVVEVTAVPHPGGVTFTVEGETEHVPPGMDNLAARAAEDVMLRAGRSGHGVRMVLRKRIPAGAGLGGGSADAAATLVAVRKLLELELTDDDLLAIAAKLGSDVPFCLQGGAAWMRGRGEILEPVALRPGLGFLVAIPPFRLATPTVYQAWDELGGPEASRRVEPHGPVARLIGELANDLEPAAEMVEPGLAEFRRALEQAAGRPAILAGSGSAYVVPIERGVDPASLAEGIGRRLRVPVAGARSTAVGVRIGT
ncbi:MAG: 4-(cytidine 5'-diphospho)-2-C-methyl-D-erythritol kinase [Acidimicrobiia bacterium]